MSNLTFPPPLQAGDGKGRAEEGRIGAVDEEEEVRLTVLKFMTSLSEVQPVMHSR